MTFLVFSGWSAVSANLSKEYGFVVSSSADWGLDLCTYPMSIMVTIILKSYGTMLFARYLEMTKKKKFFFLYLDCVWRHLCSLIWKMDYESGNSIFYDMWRSIIWKCICTYCFGSSNAFIAYGLCWK